MVNEPTQLDQLKKQTELLNAQKALADAQKDLATSQSQAAVAQRFGAVTQGPFTGAVNVKDKAGTEEAQLLAARAVRIAAKRIVAEVRKASEATTLCLFPLAQAPAFDHLNGYRLRVELLAETFASLSDLLGAPHAPPEEAKVLVPAQPGAQRPRAFLPAAVLASAGLDSVAKLLDFFKTDYEVGANDAAIADTALLFAVVGAVHKSNAHGQQHIKAMLPLFENRHDSSLAVNRIKHDVQPLAEQRAAAADRAAALQAQLQDAQTSLQTAATDAKPALQARVDRLRADIDRLTAVTAGFDAFVTAMTTPDASGVMPLAVTAREMAVEEALKGDADVLLLHIENSGGGYLVKKNVFASLFSMPLYHSGGATATFVLQRGRDGAILAGDIVPVYGGLIASDDLAAVLDAG